MRGRSWHRGIVLRAALGLLGMLAGLGAVAFAATRPEGVSRGGQGDFGARLPLEATQSGRATARPPRPKITQHPDPVSVSTSARFSFTVTGSKLRFQCRLDRQRWIACRAPVAYQRLAVGRHRFLVRTRDRDGRRGGAARFRWTLLEPKGFSIEPKLTGLGSLYPGTPPVALPLTIVNPNPVPIFLTDLRAAATASPPGCAGAENLELVPAGVSSATPLEVPAGGSVSLPAQGVTPPTIRLRDLPVSQDACQSTQFPLAFSGTARG